MEAKSVFKSKLNWVGLLLVLTPLIEPAREFALEAIKTLPDQYEPMAVSALGLLIVVLRTFFTSKPVAIKPAE